MPDLPIPPASPPVFPVQDASSSGFPFGNEIARQAAYIGGLPGDMQQLIQAMAGYWEPTESEMDRGYAAPPTLFPSSRSIMQDWGLPPNPSAAPTSPPIPSQPSTQTSLSLPSFWGMLPASVWGTLPRLTAGFVGDPQSLPWQNNAGSQSSPMYPK